MKSMTGYGYNEALGKSGAIFKIEIRSVNRKQLDLKVILPQELNNCELAIRKYLTKKISRGNVSVNIQLSYGEELLKKSININQKVLLLYLENAKDLSKKFNISSEFTLAELYKLPYVIESVTPKFSLDQVEKDVINILESAYNNFDRTKTEEGEFLKQHLAEKLKILSKFLLKIEPLCAELPLVRCEKLKERIKISGIEIVDENTINREIVLYSDKYDVSEEITRLKSHFKMFEKLMADNIVQGRSLDFLVQEMQREINTLGVKASSIETTPLVVQFKTELEKIREQIQNIE